MSPLATDDWGTVEYRAALARQHAMVEARAAGAIPDTLVLCDHPAVVTLGRATPPDAPRPAGIPVVEVERGGAATWHGPGQLVGYPIVDLGPRGRDVHAFLRGLEDALAAVCADLWVAASRRSGHTGLFVAAPGTPGGFRKVASIGIAVRRWVTYHGFALNLDTAPDAFAGLRPCGFEPAVMTSVRAVRGTAPTRAEAVVRVAGRLGEWLGRATERASRPASVPAGATG